MRRFFGFLVLLAVVFIAVGFWLGWFQLFVNRGKMQHDTQRIEEKVKKDIHSGAKKVEQKTDHASDNHATP